MSLQGSNGHSATVIVRVSQDLADSLDARVEKLRVTRSDYIRMLLMLPITFETEATMTHSPSDTRRDAAYSVSEMDSKSYFAGRLTASFHMADEDNFTFAHAHINRDERRDDSHGGSQIEVDTSRVTILTTSDVTRLTTSIDRIGVNYNQAVHALNALIKRYSDAEELLDSGDIANVVEWLKAVQSSNEQVSHGLAMLAREAASIVDAPMMRVPFIKITGRKSTSKRGGRK